MISAQSSIVIARPIDDVFQFISVDFFSNYPKWSPEVIELEQLSDGPVGEGTLGRQVRKDQGRRTESTFRVTRFEPNRCFCCEGTAQTPFRVIYDFASLEQTTRISFTFELLKIDFFMRPFEKLIEAAIRGGTNSTVHNLKGLLEEKTT
ncbi:SRPBCC family protein [Nitrosococcus watsonii]|uniref:Polyketide cyclase/dehydrase n=1 Tax=Nitrosococcus watsoni (strain C-113) TaxID=105559 RepID=D8KC93_NITWC|nr:SRPBCC family protein [Nitrosococcus watsonii]ADJ29764.1 Polyketide cyclase/dehydrase [Nitrosococcus watsonii C-113]